MPCSRCGGSGHNAKTCGSGTGVYGMRAIAKPKKTARPRVWCHASQTPYYDAATGQVYLVNNADEREQCPCGGSYIKCGTARGAASFRNHISSERHMAYMCAQYGHY